MDGKELLGRLKRLSEIEDANKDIHTLTYAQFPGTHCPLMGAAMAIRGIDEAVMMIIGTDECSYYTKHMTIYSEDWGGLDGRCVSVTIDQHDITFGCASKVEEAYNELLAERSPQAVFLVTTCVPEIIGDDFDAVADALTEKYGIPVMAVHTEHFKCENHMPGVERTITSTFKLMQEREKDGSVNVIGQRMGRFESTELFRILKSSGVKIGAQIPSGCSIEAIRNASAAKVNIVVNEIGLPLAKKMKQRFGTPYVFFDKFVSPEHIGKAYSDLFDFLSIPEPCELENLRAEAEQAVEKGRKKLDGVSFIYGNTPFCCFEACEYMSELGMIPQLIQCHGIGENDKQSVSEILKKSDPYITQSANISPMQYIYDVLKPMLYLGHEYAMRLKKKKIAQVHTDMGGAMLGYEVTGYFTEQLIISKKESELLQKEDDSIMNGMMGMPGNASRGGK
ncbi:MAG: nitrogenase component 1 [Lachnospiraceae bacterium]|nr:nitrogenase component 1 [Lachnospiraceae bacterium]